MKRRFSFVGKKHTLKIDEDLWAITQQYVKDQFAIMTRHGSAPPTLSESEYSDLVYDIAKTPQTIRNLNEKIARKNEREARRAAAGSRAVPQTV